MTSAGFPLFDSQFTTVAGVTRLILNRSRQRRGQPFLTVPGDLWFLTPTDRNTFFQNNPRRLVDAVTCVVGDVHNVNTFMLTLWSAARGEWWDVTGALRPRAHSPS